MNGLFLARANASLDGMLALLADNAAIFPPGTAKKRLPRRAARASRTGAAVDVNSPETPFITRHFSVLLDESGDALDVNTDSIAAVSSEEAVLYAQRALDKADSGYLGVYRYRVAATDEGALVVFLDASTQLATARQFLVISGAVALGVCLAVFLLALLFSAAPCAHRPERGKAAPVHHRRRTRTEDAADHHLRQLRGAGDGNGEKRVAHGHREAGGAPAETGQRPGGALAAGRGPAHGRRSALFPQRRVCDTALAFSAAAERAGKRLRVEVEPAVFVTGDEAALRQLTAILVDNAVKYADAGGEAAVCLRGGRPPVLTVENDCRNVDELPLQRLFDRFYRFDSARTGDGSHGLGFPSPAPSPKPPRRPARRKGGGRTDPHARAPVSGAPTAKPHGETFRHGACFSSAIKAASARTPLRCRFGVIAGPVQADRFPAGALHSALFRCPLPCCTGRWRRSLPARRHSEPAAVAPLRPRPVRGRLPRQRWPSGWGGRSLTSVSSPSIIAVTRAR